MDDDDATSASEVDQLRDRIFRKRLQIEELRRGGDIEALRSSLAELQKMVRLSNAAQAQKSKRRAK